MTIELFSIIAGAVLSWILDNFPKVRDWFGGKTSKEKVWIVRGFLVLLAAAIVGLQCWEVTAGLVPNLKNITCDEDGLTAFIIVLFYALIGNQSWFLLNTKR